MLLIPHAPQHHLPLAFPSVHLIKISHCNQIETIHLFFYFVFLIMRPADGSLYGFQHVTQLSADWPVSAWSLSPAILLHYQSVMSQISLWLNSTLIVPTTSGQTPSVCPVTLWFETWSPEDQLMGCVKVVDSNQEAKYFLVIATRFPTVYIQQNKNE